MHMRNKDISRKSEARDRKFENIRDAKRRLKLPNMIKGVRCIVLHLANLNMAVLTLNKKKRIFCWLVVVTQPA